MSECHQQSTVSVAPARGRTGQRPTDRRERPSAVRRVWRRLRWPLLAVALAVPSVASAAAPPATNHLGSVTVSGTASLLWRVPKGHTAPVLDVRVPGVVVELRCRRRGFRPALVTLGVGGLAHGVQQGRAISRAWNPKKQRTATVRARLGPFTARERGPKQRRKLRSLTDAVRTRCTTGKGPASHTLTLQVSGRCARVKGFGASTASVGAERRVVAKVVCAGAPATAAPPAKARARPQRRARKRP